MNPVYSFLMMSGIVLVFFIGLTYYLNQEGKKKR